MEQFNLNWHTYNDHLKEMMKHLMQSNESTDITLVCEDRTKFKAHKFVLNACSPLFQSIINDLSARDPVIFLRGVFAQEMKSILQFMYVGQATFYQERLNEFLNVAKSLEIKEISKDVNCDGTEASETYVNMNNDDIPKNQESSNLPEANENSNNIANEIASYKYPHKLTSPENDKIKYQTNKISYITEAGQYQCTQCNKVFTGRGSMHTHFKSVHEGVNYQCNECDKRFSQKVSLITHQKGVHEGVKFQCNECDKRFSQKITLINHQKGVHKGVKFQCNKCAFSSSDPSNLNSHKKRNH